MKKVFVLLLGVILVTTPLSSALAWGSDGHQTIGQIASLRIRPRTARQISEILKPGETLANISTWADTVKERVGKTDPDPETNAFLQDVAHNATNREWHYVNLPLNCRSYQTCRGFTLKNDVVHMLNVSIRTLQGKPSARFPLSKRNALKLLVHLVGDIHQPLHVGVGYIDADDSIPHYTFVGDPVVIRRKHLSHDKGGNDLVIDGDRQNLHGFWDFGLVTSLKISSNHQSPESMGEFLYQSVNPTSSWNSQGPVSTWAAQWATDSLQKSRNQTYASVKITGRRTIPVLSGGKPVINNGQLVMQKVYDVSRAADYETANREVVRQQLALGGFRLAKLLDAIYSKRSKHQ